MFPETAEPGGAFPAADPPVVGPHEESPEGDSERAGLGDEAYLAALAGLGGMGPARLERLLERWSPAEAWRMLATGRVAEAVREVRVAERLVQRWARDAARADPARIYRRHAEIAVTVTRRGAPGYPARLAHDSEPPAVLFSQGSLEWLERPTVAIVGTRRCTRYGADVAFDLGRAAAAHGATVVSGLAVGIDAAAHAGALAADEAPPVGVVGSGLDRIYPRENAVLWKMVAQRGLLLSEAPLGAPPERWRFPARNRIMAALADVCVIVESHAEGGAMGMITEAARRGRAVAAVPGPIRSPASAGSNRLIAEGCGVLCDTDDLLVLLEIERTKLPFWREEPAGDDPCGDGGRVLEAFGWMPATLEMLADRTGMELGDLSWQIEQLVASDLLVQRGLWYERRSGTSSGAAPSTAVAGRSGGDW